MEKSLLYQILVFTVHRKTKKSYNNNEFKISGPTWNDAFELPDGSYSISDIQDHFEYILKKHNEKIDNPLIRTYVNKTEIKIKTRYYLQLLTLETMKLLGSTKNKITEDKNDGNVPHLEINKVLLVHRNNVNND